MWQCDVSIAIILSSTKLRRQRGSSNANAPGVSRLPRSTWPSEKQNARYGFVETLQHKKYAQHNMDISSAPSNGVHGLMAM